MKYIKKIDENWMSDLFKSKSIYDKTTELFDINFKNLITNNHIVDIIYQKSDSGLYINFITDNIDDLNEEINYMFELNINNKITFKQVISSENIESLNQFQNIVYPYYEEHLNDIIQKISKEVVKYLDYIIDKDTI